MYRCGLENTGEIINLDNIEEYRYLPFKINDELTFITQDGGGLCLAFCGLCDDDSG